MEGCKWGMMGLDLQKNVKQKEKTLNSQLLTLNFLVPLQPLSRDGSMKFN
jgi:hypothetical protein